MGYAWPGVAGEDRVGLNQRWEDLSGAILSLSPEPPRRVREPGLHVAGEDFEDSGRGGGTFNVRLVQLLLRRGVA